VKYSLEIHAENVKHVDIKTIVVTAPNGDGNQDIKVVSAIGTSNGVEYEYHADGTVPINFDLKTWTKPDGSDWNVFSVTCITIGKDFRYYMGSQSGFVLWTTFVRLKLGEPDKFPATTFLEFTPPTKYKRCILNLLTVLQSISVVNSIYLRINKLFYLNKLK